MAPAFRIATYNVLADAYAGQAWHRENLFAYCVPGVIDAPRRRQLILRDLLKINADLVGLQEVDSGQLAALTAFGARGWDHLYTRKAGAAADGCALFWRRSRFQLEASPLELRLGGSLDALKNVDPALLAAIRAHEPTNDVLAQVTTIAHGVILRDLNAENRRMLVANTHLFYHPNANHIRLLQLHMLLTELAYHVRVLEADGGGPVGVILLGDLNARKGNFGPSDVGLPPQAAYRLIRDGAIYATDSDWLHSSWRPEEWRSGKMQDAGSGETTAQPADQSDTVSVCDGLGLQGDDAAELLRLELRLPLPLIDPNGHVEVTNFTAGFQECLDYTLLDARVLGAARLIPPPPEERLRAETALPSTVFPSDHIPVVVDVAYLDTHEPVAFA